MVVLNLMTASHGQREIFGTPREFPGGKDEKCNIDLNISSRLAVRDRLWVMVGISARMQSEIATFAKQVEYATSRLDRAFVGPSIVRS